MIERCPPAPIAVYPVEAGAMFQCDRASRRFLALGLSKIVATSG
jgi:hypothetical protein